MDTDIPNGSTGPRKRYVSGPDGAPLTVADLPPSETRWTPYKKATVVLAVRGGLISLAVAEARWNISLDEFLEWDMQWHASGLKGFQTHVRKRTGRTGRPIGILSGDAGPVSFGPVAVSHDGLRVFGMKVASLGSTRIILGHFMSNPGRVFSHRALSMLLYGPEEDWPDSVSLKVHLTKIGKVLRGAGLGEPYIVSVWGRGYMLPSDSAR